MYLLGMESSCDETSCAVVRVEDATAEHPRFTICANIVASQIETHRLYGGVVPEIAGRAHIEAVSRVTYEALDVAGIGIDAVDAVAVTTHPGLIGALLVGVNFAKSLACSRDIPLVSVNHIHAHVAAAYLSDPTLTPPFLALVVSGGHTQLYMVEDALHFRVLGGTRDDAAGEAFDKIGRVIGLPYPGGAALDALAYEGRAAAYALPSPALSGERPDFSFSGLKTAALNLINGARQRGEDIPRADLAASYTATIVRGLVDQTVATLRRSGAKTLVLAGGVAANSHLRSALACACERCAVRLVTPPVSLCGDNGAMVAAAGYFRYRAGLYADTDLNASAADEM